MGRATCEFCHRTVKPGKEDAKYFQSHRKCVETVHRALSAERQAHSGNSGPGRSGAWNPEGTIVQPDPDRSKSIEKYGRFETARLRVGFAVLDKQGEQEPRPCDSYPACDVIRDELNGRKRSRLSREQLAMMELMGGGKKDG